MTEPQRVGGSSLEILGRLAPADEEVVRQIPLDELRPDPDQPRTDFAGDSVRTDDSKELSALADNLRAVGFAQPLRVRPDPEGDGYRIITGERRWRAARLAGLKTAPCLVDAESRKDHLRLALQLSENLQRRDLRLVDVAATLARLRKETGLSDRELAELLGRSRSWLSHHLRPLKARGLAREALEADLLRSAETLRLFEKLPLAQQQRLLQKARKAGTPIPRGAISGRLAQAQPTGSPATKRCSSAGKPQAKPSAASPSTPGASDDHTSALQLSAHEWHLLFRALGRALPPEPSEWPPALKAILRALGPDDD